MRQIALILGAFAFAPILAAAQVTVSGTVLDENRMPLELAHVHIFAMPNDIGSEPIETIEVSGAGDFSFTLDEPGYYNVAVTGVNHEALTTPLIIGEEEEEVSMNAFLAPLQYNRDPEGLQIIGDWNDFNFQTASPMVKNKEGEFVYTFKTDKSEVHYQIIGLAGGNAASRSVNQPGSDAYVYDGGGDYRSIIRVKPGEVTIVVDPSTLPVFNGGGPMVMFEDTRRNQIYELHQIYEETKKTVIQETIEARAAAAESGEEVTYDPTPLWRGVAEMAANFMMITEHSAEVRQFAALSLSRLLQVVGDPKMAGITPERIAMVRDILPLSAPLWEMDPMTAISVATYGLSRDDIEGHGAAMMSLYEESTVPVVKGMALANAAMVAKYQGDQEELKSLYETLANEYGDLDNEMISYYIDALDPNTAVQVGKPVPDFQVVLEDGKGTIVSKESMKGKYYLIDFWATWCGPCVGEMPQLHAAYKRFAGSDFEVLSLSFDSDFSKVVSFRENRYPMPWLHTFVEGGFRNELSQTFEVSGIPKPILVNPEGIIVATEGELRGDRLETTLAKFLGDGQAMN